MDGGAAKRDGELKVCDKLLSVNGVSVIDHSLEFAVQQLVSVPMGGVARIGVCHPLPATSTPDICINPPSSSNLGGPFMEERSLSLREDDTTVDGQAMEVFILHHLNNHVSPIMCMISTKILITWLT